MIRYLRSLRFGAHCAPRVSHGSRPNLRPATAPRARFALLPALLLALGLLSGIAPSRVAASVSMLGTAGQIANNSTLAFTVAAGNNRVLVVAASGFSITGATDITGVTFGGTAMTQAVKLADGAAAV